MFTWQCNRSRFADYLANDRILQDFEVKRADAVDSARLGDDDLLLVWRDTPVGIHALPRAIVVAEGVIPDFMAWVSTYFRNIRPFTAQCRVLTPTLARLVRRTAIAQAPPQNSSFDAGFIIGEAAAYAAGRSDSARLPYASYTRTLSFSLAQCHRRYDDDVVRDVLLAEIARSWASTRDSAARAAVPLTPNGIRDVWRAWLEAPNESESADQFDDVLIAAVLGIRRDGLLPDHVWSLLGGAASAVPSFIRQLDGPREDRITVARAAAEALRAGPEPTRLLRSLLLGYIVSRIDPGSLEYFPLLTAVAPSLPEAFLWYGACSSVARPTAVNSFGNSVGWLLTRELQRAAHWLDAPECDIGLQEFTVLSRSNESIRASIRTMSPGTLRVELFPLVTTNVRWVELGDDLQSDRTVGADQRMLFDEARADSREGVVQLLRKLDDNMKALQDIRRLAEAALGDRPRSRRSRKS